MSADSASAISDETSAEGRDVLSRAHSRSSGIMWYSRITWTACKQKVLLSQRGRAMLHVCQQLASIVQYVDRNLLLLVTSASDLPLRTTEFCSLLFGVFTMSRGLCRKQTCTVTVIHYCTDDRQLFIALQQSSIR